MKIITSVIIAAFLILSSSCKSTKIQGPPDIYTYNSDTTGTLITIEFEKGKEFNYPLIAIWVEDEQGEFVQTLYIAESIGKGVFDHAGNSTGKWMPGPILRPAALPYWSHQRGIKNPQGFFLPDIDNPIADAYTGPTPTGNFEMNTRIESANLRVFSVYFEINQTWDWNEFWTNNKYPDDQEYKTSCQPALVYKTVVNLDSDIKMYELAPIGHSHYSGKTGELFTDLSTMTTSLNIVKSIKVLIP